MPANNMKRLVPWFSMEEWEFTYRLIYSADVVDQTKGYERLLVWKARYPDLPAGVQCTLDVLQVSLRDHQLWTKIVHVEIPSYHEQELRLMYSTAIMRFLNHISSLTELRKETLYRIASQLHIPSWVVSIRHDAAHGNRLPPLSLLRAAAQLSLNWLHEHYWKNEAEESMNYIIEEEFNDTDEIIKQVTDILELCQALVLYHQCGYTTLARIPDSEIKLHLARFKARKTQQDMDHRHTSTSDYEMKDVNTESDSEVEANLFPSDENQSVFSVVRGLIKELRHCLKPHKHAAGCKEIIVNMLLNGDVFLTSFEVIEGMCGEQGINRLNKNNLPIKIINVWKEMFKVFPASIVIFLFEKLINFSNNENEIPHRRRMAAIWVKEITLGFAKVRKALDLTEHKSVQLYIDAKRCAPNKPLKRKKIKFSTKKPKLKVAKVSIVNETMTLMEKRNPKLKNVLSLSIRKLPSNIMLMELLKDSLLNPHKWTSIFLPSLLELLDPPLPSNAVEHIISLIQIYTQNDTSLDEVDTNSPVYTVETLTNISEINEDIDAAMDVDVSTVETPMLNHDPPSHAESLWSKAQGFLEWSKCPLGVLPWQKDEPFVKCDLPRDTVWRAKDTITYEDTGYLEEFLPKQINWQNFKLKKKKPRKNKMKNMVAVSNIIEKALLSVKY